MLPWADLWDIIKTGEGSLFVERAVILLSEIYKYLDSQNIRLVLSSQHYGPGLIICLILDTYTLCPILSSYIYKYSLHVSLSTS